MAARPSTAGRVILGTMQSKRLQALVYWVKDRDKRGLIAQPGLWDNKAMIKAMERKEPNIITIRSMLELSTPASVGQTTVGTTGRTYLPIS